jgi:autotransporter passenger strand-loop-strand repeat protein
MAARSYLAVYTSGSVAEFDTINPGGIELVSGGGVDAFALLRGMQLVQNGGQAIGTDVRAGGQEVVQAGGLARGVVIDGGLVEVQAGGTASVSFDNVNGGVLQLDASQSFVGDIARFASPPFVTEEIDLRDIAFGPNTKLAFIEAPTGTSGTLTVTDGTHIADLTLLGQYSTADFHLASDGHGGTIVTDPSLVGSAASPVLAPPLA